ncbi:MAG: hypothetical protein Q8P01_04150 [bacterium]|nr:hypothetical protein [bacterium]
MKSLPLAIVFAAILIAASIFFSGSKNEGGEATLVKNVEQEKALEEQVFPKEGITLPIQWGDIGKKLVEKGAIDKEQFEAIYETRGGLAPQEQSMLSEEYKGKIVMNSENANVLLNIFWALGLANKNTILEKGPMTDPKYGGAGNFASTGGWTIAKGDAMDHYSAYELIKLSEEEQAKVERVSQGIYRPCCGNSTYFPDCNHGMAMLGLLELMAANGVSEKDMYKVALQVNSYWFPETYLTIAAYKKTQGVPWDKVDAKEVLGPDYSSASGYQNIKTKTEPQTIQGGGGCGV